MPRNTLLCDTVKEAQQLAYMGPERHKVVAQDGTLFSKGGCITGGLTGNEQNRAARFEEQDTAALKQVGVHAWMDAHFSLSNAKSQWLHFSTSRISVM